MPDPKRLARELKDLIDEFRRETPELKLVSAIKDKAAELEAELSEGAATDIDAFFSAVGGGVLKAQRDLDEQSRTYLAGNPPYASVFRIPKASAEFQFAISNLKGKKVSLLVYGSRENQERSVQQKVSFDVVSAPPPAEMREDSGVGRALVGDLHVREAFREALRGFRAKQPADTAMAKRALLFLRNFDRVLIVRGPSGWALVLPFRHPSQRWDLDGFLVADHEDGIVIDAVTYCAEEADQPPAESHPRIFGLAAFLHGLAALQKQRLAAARQRRASSEPPEAENPGDA